MSREGRRVEWSLDLEHMKVRAGQFVSDAIGGAAETKTASLAEPLDGAAAATIALAFPAGQASVRALEARSLKLFAAELSYVGEYEFIASGSAERRISLRQKRGFSGDLGAMAGKAQGLRWDIAIARNLPVRLGIVGGVGEANFDLSGLQIDALQLETGVGNVLATLPAQGRPLAAEIRGGVGLTEINVPAGASGKLDITGGLGGVTVGVSQDAALRVAAKRGLGAIDLPEGWVRVGGEKQTEELIVWQTAGYADALQSLTLLYAGGVGRFSLVDLD